MGRSKMKYKELKKLLKKTRLELFRCKGRLAMVDKTVDDLIEFSNQQERIQITTEKELEKQWVILSYLEARQVKLIQAMAD